LYSKQKSRLCIRYRTLGDSQGEVNISGGERFTGKPGKTKKTTRGNKEQLCGTLRGRPKCLPKRLGRTYWIFAEVSLKKRGGGKKRNGRNEEKKVVV